MRQIILESKNKQYQIIEYTEPSLYFIIDNHDQVYFRTNTLKKVLNFWNKLMSDLNEKENITYKLKMK